MKEFQTNFDIRELPIHKIICGDCLEKMREYLPDNCIDLIYLDPPFFSGRDYEEIWHDGSETRSFRDTSWYQKICKRCEYPLSPDFLFCPRCSQSTSEFDEVRTSNLQAYLNWLEPRLKECHRVLRDSGSIYVHLDWHAVHYVKVILDQIFGYQNFRNEIIWCYKGGNASKKFRSKHDTILFYSKSDDYFFNSEQIRIPYSSKILRVAKRDSKNRLYYRTGHQNKYGEIKVYLHPKGQLPYDWWIDIPNATTVHAGFNYPTQKPEALLKRIIQASSKPGDLILDPFAGGGTALIIAHQLRRHWIGIDVSPTACRASFRRFLDNGFSINFADLIDLPATEEELKELNAIELKNWVANRLNLRASTNPRFAGQTFEGIPVLVSKRELEAVLLRKLTESLKLKKCKLISFDFGEEIRTEVKNLQNEHSIEIELIELEEILC